MARSFRYFGKKRGNRRTGSPALATAGEAVFFGVLFLLGCVGLAIFFVTLVIPQWRVNVEFVEHTCRVVDKDIKEIAGKSGARYLPRIKIEYEIDGVIYSDWHYDIHNTSFTERAAAQAVLDQFSLYEKTKDFYPCWYNPTNPREAVLVCGYRWWIWLVFTVPISCVLIGAGGLVYAWLHWGKSAERRAAMAQRAPQRDLFAVVDRGDRRYPTIPQGDDITNSPGTRLRFRLPVAGLVGWLLFGALAFCIVWNACVAVAIFWAARGFLDGKPDWIFALLILPFLAIGVGAVYFLIRRLRIASGTGVTLVEISDHPLQPGGLYRVFLSQSGRLKVKRLRVSLVCEEAATYRQGTNTRREVREVYRQELLVRDAFEIERSTPFDSEFDLLMPAGAMHSFLARHNQIQWKLVVDGETVNWPEFHRAFTVIVRPRDGEANA